jgi:hypothetical protein
MFQLLREFQFEPMNKLEGKKRRKLKGERERERKGMFGMLMKSTTHTHVQVDRVPTLDKLITKQKMNTHTE